MNNVSCKFAVIADPHYYSETLGNSGEAYERRAGSDQKLLAETKGIVKAALDEIKASDAEFLLIAGDLSNDGERASHEEMRELLYEFKKSKPVYVITATHDWCCDGNPRRYEGSNVYNDVPTLGADELRDFYRDFGPETAVAEYFTHLKNSSYVVRPKDGVSVFCLNDDQSGEGSSGYSAEHFEWIKNETEKAKSRGDIVFGMQHHHLFLTEFDRVINGNSSVEYRKKQASRFADIGFNVMFVGHSHMQHIREHISEGGNSFFEINVASISGYPAPIVYCEIKDGKLVVKTKHLESFTYNGRQYTNDYLKAHATELFSNVITAAVNNEKEEFAALTESIGLSREKSFKLWKFVRPLLKKLDTLTVRSAARLINLLTFGKGITKSAAREIGNTKVKDIIFEAFHSILDGSLIKHEKGSAYYTVFTDALSLPLKIVKKLRIKNGGLLRTLTHLKNAAHEIMTGEPLDNNDFTITLE